MTRGDRLILDILTSSRSWDERRRSKRCNCEAGGRKVIPNERSFPFGVTLAPVTFHFVRNFDVTKFLFKIPRHAIGMNLSGEGESSAVSFMLGQSEQRINDRSSRCSFRVGKSKLSNYIWNINCCFNLSCIVLWDVWSLFHLKFYFWKTLRCFFFFFFFKEDCTKYGWISFKIRRRHACFIRSQFQKAINIQISLLAIDLD